jgi:hypothetical protein
MEGFLMKKSVLFNWIAAGLGLVAIIALCLNCVTYSLEVMGVEVSESWSGWTVIFGSKEDGFKFSFMNLVTLLLILAGAACAVLANLKPNKLFNYVAAACLVLAGVLFFLMVAFTQLEGVSGNEASQIKDKFFGLGFGAILGAIVSIAGGAVAFYSTIMAKKEN